MLRAKYHQERDKRIRDDGNEQYIEPVGKFAHYLDDPYVDAKPREPLTDEVTFAFIGGGFAGLVTGARLKEAGIDDVRIIEKGGDFGGTWYWNRYPGAMCDTAAFIYMPLLEETGHMPSRKYTRAPEILEHCQRIGNHYGLYENAVFSTEVTDLTWNQDLQRWIIRTNRGDEMRAKFVATGTGPLHRPKLPGIEGIESFQGHSFHTSRWDYNYTGGSSHGDLTGLKDKKVAIIGTGATAVQAVPHLGASAKELFVFQRTPSSIDERNNQATDPEWISTQEKGWQDKRRRNFESIMTGGMVKEDLVNDGWTEAFRLLFGSLRDKAPSKFQIFTWSLTSVASPKLYKNGFKQYMTDKVTAFMDLAKSMEIADYKKMEKVRARADAIVEDKETAEALKPYYRQFCKRPCFHDEYLSTFNLPNVTLVNTDGKGLEQITEKGIMFDGKEYEVDCIIFATGFEVGTDYSRRAGYQIYGVDGLSVSDKWSGGLSTFHGMHSRGFPNAFFFGPAQSGFTATYTYSLDEQSIHLSHILSTAIKKGATRIEASEKAEKKWVETIIEKSRLTADFQEKCTPGYYNNEGQINPKPQNNMYGGGPIEFFGLMKKWRSKGNLEGLELN